MSTCCGLTGVPSFTAIEIQAPFPNGIVPTQMPQLTNGLASSAWVQNYINTLESSGRLPITTRASELATTNFSSPESQDPLKIYVQKENEFQTKLKSEYCFYEARYAAALNDFLSSVAMTTSTPEKVSQKLQLTRRLNEKLTILTQIADGVTKYRNQTSRNMQQSINSVNTAMQARRQELLDQQEILSSESAGAELSRRMADYAKEKAKANNNLLSLYGVLNIVALAMIFYIARS